MTSRLFPRLLLAAALAPVLLVFGACDKHDPKIVYGEHAAGAHGKKSGESGETAVKEKSGGSKAGDVPAVDVPKFFR